MRDVTFLVSYLIVLCAIEGCAQTPERLVTPITSQPVATYVQASNSADEDAVNSEQQAPSKRPQEVKSGSKPREPMGILDITGLFLKSFAMGFLAAAKKPWDCYEALQDARTGMYVAVLTGERSSQYTDQIEQRCRDMN